MLETRLDETGTKGYAVGFQDLIRFVMARCHRAKASKTCCAGRSSSSRRSWFVSSFRGT
jgi:hypothetical protein